MYRLRVLCVSEQVPGRIASILNIYVVSPAVWET